MSEAMNGRSEGGQEEEISSLESEESGGLDEPKGPSGPTYGIFESLRVYPVPSTTSKVAGYVSCKIKTELGYIFLNSMALVWGNNGLFLSFPSRKKENSPRGHEDYYFFERDMREKLQEHAIAEYKNKGGNLVQPVAPTAPPQQNGMGGGRQPYGQVPPPRYNNPGYNGGYGNSGGYGPNYGAPPRHNNGYNNGYGNGNGNGNGYGNNYGNNYGNGNYGPPRRPMGGYDSNGGMPRRPMSSGSDYTQRPPRNYDRQPQRPPRPNDSGNFGTTPIKDDED